MRVLGIESSCDELACAILDHDGRTLLADVVHSQVDVHRPFGGVVPEVASRDHVRRLHPVLEETLRRAHLSFEDIDAIAVTTGPGLIGSLLCGVEFAKGLSLASGRPLIGVNHLEGHVAAVLLEDETPSLPFVSLLVSGGHSNLVLVHDWGRYEHLGATRDDAAGEAFDKTAKLLGLGYPGGAKIDRLASGRRTDAYTFPTMMAGKDNLDFSFSGLKTAVARMLKEMGGVPTGDALGEFCAAFQDAIAENLLKKAFRATKKTGTNRLVLAGGVAANSRLRERAAYRGRREQVRVYLPSRRFCTDNAAMIARAGLTRLSRGEQSGLDLVARANLPLFERRARR